MGRIPCILLNSPSRPTSERAVRPLWSKGFRPFFLGAATFAASFLPLWLLVWFGVVDLGAYWTYPLWHGHEMVFGYTMAVIAGFLLTAVSNWTGRETATGRWLVALVLLWTLGRLALLFSAYFPALAVVVLDVLFVPALAVAVARPLIASGNRRNYLFVGILSLFALANLAMHLDANGLWNGAARPALLASIDLVLLVSLVIGGRIIPAFTRNATGRTDLRTNPHVDRAVVIGMVALGLTAVILKTGIVVSLLSAAVGLLVFVRMTRWGTASAIRKPILWVLHLGHAWLGAGLLLRGAGGLGWIIPSAATHVLTLGAIGTLTLGMMSRVPLGHTGRPLVVSRPVVAAYILVTVAVVARGIVPIVVPGLAASAYILSGAAFALAFAVYVVVYTPILLGPRVDRG